MKRILLTLALCFGICMFLPQFAWAVEDYDFREDTRGYCRMVAELNARIRDQVYAQSLEESAMVLFMTNGTEIDFENAPFRVNCVAYGPRGFSTLLCDAPDAAVQWLLAQDDVKYAERDCEVSGCALDEGVTFQSWGAQALGMGEYLSFAQRFGSGSATVAVVDSGVYRHSLIQPKMSVRGYDYVDNDADPTNDLNGHGTFVAGIVADCTRDAPVNIYPIRVLDANASGKISNVVSAVLEAIAARVDVINLSLSSFAESANLEAAIREAVSSGITVVVAAGNYACDASEITPAKMMDAGVIVVGSADAGGTRSSFSNYGSSVDIYVYGREIRSCSRSGGYVVDSGTSMAAPHVSALSAMLNLVHPGISPQNVEHRLRAAAKGTILIPHASAMAPRSMGFQLNRIKLRLNDRLTLPVRALPDTAMESIQYESSDSGVVEISEGEIVAKSVGNARITATCKGLGEMTFEIEVFDGELPAILLPENLTEIGEEAFMGLATGTVIIPPGTERIGNHAFAQGSIGFIHVPDTVGEMGENDFSGAVIMCPEDSPACEYAVRQGLQYIIIDDE